MSGGPASRTRFCACGKWSLLGADDFTGVVSSQLKSWLGPDLSVSNRISGLSEDLLNSVQD